MKKIDTVIIFEIILVVVLVGGRTTGMLIWGVGTGTSMEPALGLGGKDTFYVATNLTLNDLHVGDIVDYIAPNGHVVQKRVIALPGDKVETVDGNVLFVNGLADSYAHGESKKKKHRVWTLKDDEVFCAGDNRNHSYDCRAYGPVKVSILHDKAFFFFDLPKSLTDLAK